jgi:iron complex transport system substrate-binding protein
MRLRGSISAIVVASITLTTLTGCALSQISNIEIAYADAITVTSNEELTSKRIIALANGSAEIISALGFRENLIGRDIASTDADLSSVPIVTSGHLVVAEKIISLKPDLVLIDKASGPASALDTLRSANITIKEIPDAWNLSDISSKVNSIAAAIGAPVAGVNLNLALASATSDLASAGKKIGVVFLYLRGGSAIYLIGGKGSGADSLISAIGAVDLGAARFANPFNAMSAELMAKLNPDVILVMSKGLQSVGGVSGISELPGIAQTNAGRSQRVISVDDSLLLSFGPRTPDLLKRLKSALSEVSNK